MFDKIWTYLKFVSFYCGVEHTLQADNSVVCTLLKKSKKQLEIENTFSESSIESLAEKLPKKQHISLIVNDNNVLSKEVESEQRDSLKLVHKAFPNINLEDFYYEVLYGKQAHLVSLCRKQYVDNLIETYTKNNISVTSFSLGNTSVSNIQEFIPQNNITTSNATLSKEEGRFISFVENKEVKAENYNVNGLTVNNKQLLSFSGALQTVLPKNSNVSNFQGKNELLSTTFLQSRFFSQFLKFAGLFILGLLLVNFLFFNHYFNKVNELQQTSVINNSAKEQLITLNESVSKKQKMAEDMLNSSASKSSFYVNDITKSLPSSILLQTLNYQPLEKRIKENKPIALQKNILLISGASTSSDTFSSWINSLESKDWIASLEIIDYADVSNSKSSFSIKINLDDE